MDREILRAQHNIALAYLAGNAARAFNQDLARESDRLNRMLQAGQRRYVRAVQSVLPFPGQPGFYRVSWVEETLTRPSDPDRLRRAFPRGRRPGRKPGDIGGKPHGNIRDRVQY